MHSNPVRVCSSASVLYWRQCWLQHVQLVVTFPLRLALAGFNINNKHTQQPMRVPVYVMGVTGMSIPVNPG